MLSWDPCSFRDPGWWSGAGGGCRQRPSLRNRSQRGNILAREGPAWGTHTSVPFSKACAFSNWDQTAWHSLTEYYFLVLSPPAWVFLSHDLHGCAVMQTDWNGFNYSPISNHLGFHILQLSTPFIDHLVHEVLSAFLIPLRKFQGVYVSYTNSLGMFCQNASRRAGSGFHAPSSSGLKRLVPWACTSPGSKEKANLFIWKANYGISKW